MVNLKFQTTENMTLNECNEQIHNYYPNHLTDFIAVKHTLLSTCKIDSAVQLVISNLKIIPNFIDLRHDNEFILRSLCLIENLGILKTDKLDKLEIFKMVYRKLFNMADCEMTLIIQTVEFLIRKKLVKKVKVIRRVIRFLKLNFMPIFLS